MQICCVTSSHPRTLNHEHDWFRDLASRARLRVLTVPPSHDVTSIGAALNEAVGADVVLVCLKLRLMPEDIVLPRSNSVWVLLEPDAFMNFTDTLSGSRCLHGKVERIIDGWGFDHILVRDKYSCDRLNDKGISCTWLPHAADPEEFLSKDEARDIPAAFVGTTDGGLYQERKALVRFFASQVPGSRVFDERSRLRGSAYGRVLRRTQLFLTTPIDPGGLVEKTEAKLFEAMASGCCVLRRRTAELDLLGFRENVHYLSFASRRQLKGLIAACQGGEVNWLEIARAGSAYVRSRHRWADRTNSFLEVINERFW